MVAFVYTCMNTLPGIVHGVRQSSGMDEAQWHKRMRVGFDTETTGVDTSTARIVTAALIIRVPDTITEIKTWLLDPGVEIPPETTAVHGITTEHAREHGQPAAEGLDEIAEALAEHLRNEVPVVVFNASFDLPLLEAELERHGLPSLIDRVGTQHYPVLDPLVLDRWVDRFRKGKRNLGALTEHYGVVVEDELHSADVDVLAMLDVLEEMSRRWPQIGTTDLNQLRAVQANAHRDWATNFNEYLASKGIQREPIPTTWL